MTLTLLRKFGEGIVRGDGIHHPLIKKIMEKSKSQIMCIIISTLVCKSKIFGSNLSCSGLRKIKIVLKLNNFNSNNKIFLSI